VAAETELKKEFGLTGIYSELALVDLARTQIASPSPPGVVLMP